MKFKILNNEPLQFYDSNAILTGTIKISGSGGDLYITPESGSTRDVIIGSTTTVGDVEIGGTSSPVNLKLLGGGTITSNGNILYIGNSATSDIVIISNATFTSSLQITGSLRVSGSAYAHYFVGDGSGLTNITTTSASFSQTASYVNPLNQNVIITGSVANGFNTNATGPYSHTEGLDTNATGPYSHTEGLETIAYGTGSHAEGGQTFSGGEGSHAEGGGSQAVGDYSHAEGAGTRTWGLHSHSEGAGSETYGTGSHAEGYGTITSGSYSHAEGYYTVASGSYQHVQGQFNLSSSADSAFIIGNGSSDGSRSNLVFASGSTFQVTGSVIATAGFTGSFSGSFTGTATSASITSNLSNNGYIGGSTDGTQVITFSSSSMGATTSSLGTLISSIENNNGINIAYTIRTDIAGIHSDGAFGNYIGGTLTSTWYRNSSGELTLAGSITQIKNSTFSTPSPEFTHRVDYSILGPTYKINVVATGKSGDTTNAISWKATSYIVTSPSVTI